MYKIVISRLKSPDKSQNGYLLSTTEDCLFASITQSI